MEFFINRFCHVPRETGLKMGTFGSFQHEGHHLAFTVEPPWLDNKPFESCIPDGKYKLIPYESGRYGQCFIMVNPELNVYAFKEDRLLETDRYKCLFAHRGSYPGNFEGCVGLGESLAYNQQLMLLNTTNTTKRIMEMMGREEHDLIIYTTGGAI